MCVESLYLASLLKYSGFVWTGSHNEAAEDFSSFHLEINFFNHNVPIFLF